MAEIGTLEPDFIVLGGDIVEGGTSKESMGEVFYMMGKLTVVMGFTMCMETMTGRDDVGYCEKRERPWRYFRFGRKNIVYVW